MNPMPKRIMFTSVSVLLAFTVFVSTWFQSSAFIEESTTPKWIWFSFCSVILLLSSGDLICSKGKVEIGAFDALVFGVSGVILVYIVLRSESCQDVYTFVTFVIFYLAIKLLHKGIPVLKVLAFSIVGSAIISTLIGIKQLFNGEDLTGSYSSVVGLVTTLVMGCLSVGFILKSSLKLNRIIRVVLLAVGLSFFAMILLSKSRVGIVSLGVAVLFFIRKYKAFYLISAVVLVVCLSVFKFDKSESTKGRLFILKTTIGLLNTPDKILFGYGEDGFIANYMNQQSMSLVSELEETKQRAANIIHPLNEFLLLMVKYGIFPLAAILVICIFIIANREITTYAKALMMALFVLSIFSYPFRYPISWIVLSIVLASYPVGSNMVGLYFGKIAPLIAFACGIIVLFLTIRMNCDLRLWKKAHVNAMLGRVEISLNQYRDLEDRLKTPDFHYNYSSYLFNLGRYEESLSQLKKCALVDYETSMLSGRIYEAINQNNQAIYAFSKASSMCPNRFMPLFEIYKIHKKTMCKIAQSKYAEILLEKQIKIPSAEIDYILNTIKTDKGNL